MKGAGFVFCLWGLTVPNPAPLVIVGILCILIGRRGQPAPVEHPPEERSHITFREQHEGRHHVSG